jgi:hypothetical protein
MLNVCIPNILELYEENIAELVKLLKKQFTDEQINNMIQISKTIINSYCTNISFQDAIINYGELNHNIWQYTYKKFNYIAMYYLIMDKSIINKTVHDKLYLELGLTFAADRCKLSIIDIPATSDWKIEEYDGFETIVLV